MKHISKHDKDCETFPDGNEFCYKFKENIDNFDLKVPSASKFYFNNQERRVPKGPSNIMKEEQVMENCGFYCNELGGLTTIGTKSILILKAGSVSSRIVSYEELDDMCDTCA